MPSFNGQVYSGITGSYGDGSAYGAGSVGLSAQPFVNIDNGTGSYQADRLFHGRRTLAASASEDLDLSGSSFKDAFGNNLGFVKVKAIHISAAAANTNNVEVGNATATQFLGPFIGASHRIAIPPGGSVTMAAPISGWAVAAGSTDLLKIANSGAGTSVTYDIVIIGTSA